MMPFTIICELANNHNGSVEHGQQIIAACGATLNKYGIRGAMKFQFRHLPAFIIPTCPADSPHKHVKRFRDTELRYEQYEALINTARFYGLAIVVTPFDEASVEQAVHLHADVLKIGSCSATDWPLIETIAQTGKPVICSTGGLTLKQIDDLVSFFDHRRIPLALLHCVAVYPTPTAQLQLNHIETLRSRFPRTEIGYSTHEDPTELAAVAIAVGKGATLFERHVGLDIVNTYSSTPEQFEAWVRAYLRAKQLCGGFQRTVSMQERNSLLSLQRGVFAAHALPAGHVLQREDVVFAFPVEDGQLLAGDWTPGITTQTALTQHEAISHHTVAVPAKPDTDVLYTVIHTVRGLLNEAHIALNTDFKAEFSHHDGLSKFMQTGVTIIECINRGYCKKLLIQIPGQRHPAHFHKRKEETFQVLHGQVEVIVDTRRRTLYPGDIQLIQQGVWHEFWTATGAVIEEISTTHYTDDSFYADPAINRTPRAQRKTVVNNWGRCQVDRTT